MAAGLFQVLMNQLYIIGRNLIIGYAMDFDNWHVIDRGWPEIALKRWEAVLKPTFGGWKWGVKLLEQDGSEALWGDVFDDADDAKADCWKAVWLGEPRQSRSRRQGGSRR